MHRMLSIIPARGGSKGLPRKNILPLRGKPLIAWTIEAAQRASSVGRVVVSTDDDEIADVALGFNCDVPFRRPAELATDIATSMDVLFHALAEISGWEYVVLLQATSPLRTFEDIDAAFERMTKVGAPACVSVCGVEESPYWMYTLAGGDRLVSLLPATAVTRRQDLPPAYILNGAIYIAEINWLKSSRTFTTHETVGYVMPRARSIDIDTYEDFVACEAALSST